MELELTTLLLLAATALVAGFIDSMAGGGGLITIPALMAAGVPPTQALATNKLQACFGSFSSAHYFWRQKLVVLKDLYLAIVCTAAGSVVGTLCVQWVNAQAMAKLLPLLLMGFALYFLLSPKMSDQDSHRRLSAVPFAFLVGTGVGFYDGFFGPGTGSFFAMAFVALAGFGIAKATAHAKVLNFTANVASLVFFLIGGKVYIVTGLCMACGQVIGARLGSRMVVSSGVRLIRPLLVAMSLIMSSKLLWDEYGAEVLQRLG
ncbi:TSUP family transporter [Pokkaliibacter sp. CJK22405]|uniref:TSUP family transporter n=1 Tax=Pokkaliibacter sp. CJK22405 TaxID=3384615 RepID=UPI003985537E